jgi:hypothetical protein
MFFSVHIFIFHFMPQTSTDLGKARIVHLLFALPEYDTWFLMARDYSMYCDLQLSITYMQEVPSYFMEQLAIDLFHGCCRHCVA